MAIALQLLGLVAALAAPLPAEAGGGDRRVTWHAPAGCPDRQTVVRRLAELLGAPGSDPALHVTVHVKRDGADHTLELVARRADGRQRRRLHHRDCATLVEAAVLLVTLAVDPTTPVDPRLAAALRSTQAPPRPGSRPSPAPDLVVTPTSRAPAPWVATAVVSQPGSSQAPAAASAASPPTPRPAPTASAASESAASPAPAARAPAVRRTRPSLALRLAGGVAAGATPSVAGGLLGAVVLELGRRARVEVGGSYWAPRRVRLDDGARAGAVVSLAAGGLRGCGVPGRGRFRFPLCLGGEVGSMRATGVDLAEVRSARSLWLALTSGGAVVFVAHPRVAVWLGLDGLLALVRPQFVVDGGGEVWHARRGGIRGSLGVEVRFRARRSPSP